LLWQLRDVAAGAFDLFVAGKEDALPHAGRLDELGIGESAIVFMLIRKCQCCLSHCLSMLVLSAVPNCSRTQRTASWAGSGSDIELSGEVATMKGCSWQLATRGEPMTEGQHYWEIEITECSTDCFLYFGAVRPGQVHEKGHRFTNDAYYISGYSGALCGCGKHHTDRLKFKKGDRIGCLLDLDAGRLRYYRNGTVCGPGWEGVVGPLLRAVELRNKGDVVTALPGAPKMHPAALQGTVVY
jgi:hypothetical protein